MNAYEATDEIAAAMARIKATLEERAAEPAHALAEYDTRGLARLLRPALEKDGRGWAACAKAIGVTSPDLSRICAGQTVSAAKIFAVCDWLRIEPRKFYRPVKQECFTGKALKRTLRQAQGEVRPARGEGRGKRGKT